MPDTIYPHTKDVLKEGMWVQKTGSQKKQGIVIKVEERYHHLVYGIKATVNWLYCYNKPMRLHTTTVDSKYLKPIKALI